MHPAARGRGGEGRPGRRDPSGLRGVAPAGRCTAQGRGGLPRAAGGVGPGHAGAAGPARLPAGAGDPGADRGRPGRRDLRRPARRSDPGRRRGHRPGPRAARGGPAERGPDRSGRDPRRGSARRRSALRAGRPAQGGLLPGPRRFPEGGVEGEAARVDFPVEAGPRITFRFAGESPFGPAQLRAWLGYEGDVPARRHHARGGGRAPPGIPRRLRLLPCTRLDRGRRRVRRGDHHGSRRSGQGILASRGALRRGQRARRCLAAPEPGGGVPAGAPRGGRPVAGRHGLARVSRRHPSARAGPLPDLRPPARLQRRGLAGGDAIRGRAVPPGRVPRRLRRGAEGSLSTPPPARRTWRSRSRRGSAPWSRRWRSRETADSRRRTSCASPRIEPGDRALAVAGGGGAPGHPGRVLQDRPRVRAGRGDARSSAPAAPAHGSAFASTRGRRCAWPPSSSRGTSAPGPRSSSGSWA